MAPKILLDNWMKLPSVQGIQQRRGGMHSTGWDQVGKLRFLHFLHLCTFCFFASLPSLNWLPKIKGELCTYSEVYLWRTLSCICFFLYQSCSWLPNHAQLSFNFESAILFVGTIWQNMNKARTFVGWIKPPISFCFSLFPLLFLIECLMTTIICLITTIPRFVLMHLPNKITYKVTATWIKKIILEYDSWERISAIWMYFTKKDFPRQTDSRKLTRWSPRWTKIRTGK